jgi:lysyl-tRNA synthetase class 2
LTAGVAQPDWRPGASVAVLRQRAALNARIRAFFAARAVLEVETPLLARAGATDPYLASFQLDEDDPWLLQTSPEFAMKRLLVAGSGPIYQLCKCFRRAESGRRHNPEFTMLEWYRPGFDHHQLMVEVRELVIDLLGQLPVQTFSYRQLFAQHLQINPHCAVVGDLQRVAAEHLDVQGLSADMGRSEWLDLLMSQVIEPRLVGQGAVFVFDFPASQAALSVVAHNEHGESVAQRFELYLEGMELANGYLELLDGDELARRFARDNRRRRELDLPAVPIDTRLLAAQRAGLPACAGVALGMDRLLMHKVGAQTIDQVISFSVGRV